jgi:uncharacterized membrane protein
LKRFSILYLVTLIIMAPLDFLFLGVLAKDFYQSRVGEMLGPVNGVAAILFYLMYVVGILVFASGPQDSTAKSAFVYGALFGFFAYATYDLTNLAVLKHWSVSLAVVDIAWGTVITGFVAWAGKLLCDKIGA